MTGLIAVRAPAPPGGGPLKITTTSLPNAVVGVAYAVQLNASGGSGSYTWNLVSAVPNTQKALTVRRGGTVQMTSQAAETITVVVQVNDGVNAPVQATFTVTAVASGALALVTTGLPPATANAPYAVQCLASGGQPPYFWTSTWTASPYMDPSGLLHGVLAAAAPGTITVTDSAGASATSASLSISIVSTLSIAGLDNVDNILRLPEGFTSTLYGGVGVQAFGGTAPYTFSITSGSLPTGLTINASTGAITGTVAALAASGSGTITVTDSTSGTPQTARANFVLNVLSQDMQSRPGYNTDTGPFIKNGFLYMPDPSNNAIGYRFTPRGWNRDHYDQAPTGIGLTHPSASKAGTYLINGSVTVATYANDITANMQANDILPLYPVFYTASGAQVSGSGSTSDLSGIVAYWCANIATYASDIGNPNWIPGIANEWGPGGMTASSTWLNAHLPVIANISGISGTTITVNTVSATNPFTSCPFAWIQGAGGITNQMVTLSAPGGSSGAWTVTSSVSLSGYTSGGTLGGGSVGALRAAGWNGVIKVDAGGSGQNAQDILTYAAQIQAADPQQNVLFDLHAYGYYTAANSPVASVTTGSSTTLTLAGSPATHPFWNTASNNGQFFPAQSTGNGVVIQGAAGTGWAAMNGTYTSGVSFSASTGAPYTVTIPFNSTGLSAANFTANSARAYDRNNPVVLGPILAGLRSSNVCVYLGEFGPFHNSTGGCVSPFDFIAGMEANNIGWCYWAWDDNTGTGVTGFPMIQGTPPPHYTNPASLSPSGQGPVFHPRLSCNALATTAPTYI